MKPHGLSQNALARALGVPPRRINEIVLEKTGITADTALRPAWFFGTTAKMWTGLQADYDLRLGALPKANANRTRSGAVGQIAVRALKGAQPFDGFRKVVRRSAARLRLVEQPLHCMVVRLPSH